VNVFQKAIAATLRYAMRGSLENPATPLSFPAEWLLDMFNGGRTDSGVRVSEMTALQVSTVMACVNVIGNGVSSLPLHVYERMVKDKRVANRIAVNHPLYELLHNEPNPEMSSVTFRKTVQAHCLLWGNGYVEIQRNDDNEVVALWPRNPSRTRPVRTLEKSDIEGTEYPAGTLVFEVMESMVGTSIADTDDQGPDKIGPKRIVLAEDMVHLPGLSLDGRLGQPTIQLARQVIGLALATEKYSSKFFANNARPAGILTTPGVMQPKAVETLRNSWAEGHGGENAHKTAVLEQGVTYTKIASTPEEAQNLESRKFQRIEIANIFGVPARMVDGDEHAARSTAEQSSLEFLNYCLHPWLELWQHELKRKLFPKVGRSAGKYHAKFDTRRLMYPDAQSRSTLYGSGKQWGYLTTNDIRELEGLNPVEDSKVGDALWQPTNMQDASDPVTLGANAKAEYDKKNPPPEPPPVEPVKEGQ
jgi:HK97 family phage portal protein